MEVSIDATAAMEQAQYTSEVYFKEAMKILEWHKGATVSDAVELAKVMAQDFHTTSMAWNLQEIRDAIIVLAEREPSEVCPN